ncbi:MAG: BMP family ABC transporter substrate-binding protein [Mycoplasmataceae bacterium]|nr:BMP family ABC transporter substrate-binding protein [Mycoplasmataceae bacterium]
MNIRKITAYSLAIVIFITTFSSVAISIALTPLVIPQVTLIRETELYDNGFNENSWNSMVEYSEDEGVNVGQVKTLADVSTVTRLANDLYGFGTQTIITSSFVFLWWIIDYAHNLDPDQYIIYIDDDGTFVDGYIKTSSQVDDEMVVDFNGLSGYKYSEPVIPKDEIPFGQEHNYEPVYYHTTYFDSDGGVYTFVPTTNDDYKNVISSTFQAQESSFEAGIIGAMSVIYRFNNPDEWKVGTWGGFNIPSVIWMLSGFEAGVEFTNHFLLAPGYDVELINQLGGSSAEAYDDNNYSYEPWYSYSFNVDSTGDAAATGLISNGAKVIAPIAGGQTNNAVNQASQVDDVQIIGVDVNAADKYPDEGDLILTSSLKNTGTALYNPDPTIDGTLETIDLVNENDSSLYEENLTENWSIENGGVSVVISEENEVMYQELKTDALNGAAWYDDTYQAEFEGAYTLQDFLDISFELMKSDQGITPGSIPNDSFVFGGSNNYDYPNWI